MGGGGSSRNFSTSPLTVSQPHSVGEGCSEITFFFWVTGGQDQSNYLNSGNFFGHFRVTSRLPAINYRKKTFTKSLGGPWPPWPPPPGYATERTYSGHRQGGLSRGRPSPRHFTSSWPHQQTADSWMRVYLDEPGPD